MFRYGAILLAFVVVSFGCNEFQQAVKDAKKDVPLPPKDNYIVLLDLSDRILYNNQQQVSKDLNVIKSIYSVFKSKLGVKDPTHLYYTVNDKLKVLIAPQRTTPRNLYDLVGNLRIDLAAEKPDKKAGAITETEKTFNSTLPEIYKQAVIGNNSNAYSGADIWKYFNEDLEDDLEKDSQNTLFIITDGYMDLEKTDERPAQNNRFASCSQIINNLKKYPDWEKKFEEGDYGILPIGKKFGNLKIVLLEVNPKQEWNGEYSLLTRIWGKWFTEMGVTNYRFIKEDNINEMRESMEKFMQVKIEGKAENILWTKITDKDTALAASPTVKNILVKSTPVFKHLESNPAKKPLETDPVIPRKALSNNTDILPPDESDADFSSTKKKDNPAQKSSTASSKDDNDILKDAAPKKGFNTGIKRKKNK
jgi:hypothetical protein